MRIMRLTPYMTIDNEKFYSNNKTGFGRTCWDITKNWSNDDETFVMTLEKNLPRKINDIKFIKISRFHLFSPSNFKQLIKGYKFYKKYAKKRKKTSGKEFIQILSMIRAFLLFNAIKKAIRKVNPDIIHIHGIVPECIPFIDAARSIGIPYMINLHGVVTATNHTYIFGNNWEKDILSHLSLANDKLIFISNGIQQYINIDFKVKFSDENTKVIINGCRNNTSDLLESEIIDLRKKLLGEGKNILLISVGAITLDKGQRRIIEAINVIDSTIKQQIHLLIIGLGDDIEYCKELVKTYNLQTNISFLGYVDNTLLMHYYRSSDLLVQATSGPGFSRMYWEAFMNGIPAIACKLQPGIYDIYDPNTMILSEDFSPKEIANTIYNALFKKWNRENIIRYSLRCDWHAKCDEYKSFATNIINNHDFNRKALLINDLIEDTR